MLAANFLETQSKVIGCALSRDLSTILPRSKSICFRYSSDDAAAMLSRYGNVHTVCLDTQIPEFHVDHAHCWPIYFTIPPRRHPPQSGQRISLRSGQSCL